MGSSNCYQLIFIRWLVEAVNADSGAYNFGGNDNALTAQASVSVQWLIRES
jgi:hypothetical protein